MKTFPFQMVIVSLPHTNQLANIEQSSDRFLILSGSTTVSIEDQDLANPWPLCSAHFPASGAPIAAGILAGTAIMICDGSYMPKCFPHLAVAAWIIHLGPPSTGTPCHGVTPVHG